MNSPQNIAPGGARSNTVTVTLANDLFDQATAGDRQVTASWDDWAKILTTHKRRPRKDRSENSSERLGYSLARFVDAPCTCRQGPVQRADGGWSIGCPDFDHTPGRPHKGHRIARNVLSVTGLGIDFDKDEQNRPLTSDTAARILQAFIARNIKAVIYSTHSHTSEKPSYRIFIPFTREVLVADWDRFLPAALAVVGIPPGCHADARHFWFFPSAPEGAQVEAGVCEGEPLNVDTILATAPTSVGHVKVGSVHLPDEASEPEWLRVVAQETRVADMRGHLERELGEVHPAHAGPDTDPLRVRNKLMWTVACSVARIYGVRDPDEVLDAMLEIYNDKCVPQYDEGKIADVVRNAFAQGEKPWGDYYSPEQVAERRQYQLDQFDKPFVRLFAELGRSGAAPAPAIVTPSSGPATATAPASHIVSAGPVAVATTAAPVLVTSAAQQALNDFAKRRNHRPGDEAMDAEYIKRMLALGEEIVDGKRKRRQRIEIFSKPEDLGRIAVAVVRRVPKDTSDHVIAGILAGNIQGGLISDLEAFVREARDAVRAESYETHRAREVERPLDEFALEVSGQRCGKPYANQHNVRVALLRLQIDLAHNLLAGRQEIIRDGERIFVEDHHLKTLRAEIERKYDFKVAKDEFWDLIEVIARESPYHPVLDCLNALPPDAPPGSPPNLTERWLIDYAGVEDTPYVRAVSRLILVAAVRRVRRPGCKFDEMLILESDTQGFYKSTLVKALAMDEAWFTSSLHLSGDERRWMEATEGKWICEAGELSKMSKTESNELKAGLSREVDETRLAYGRLSTRRPRQFVIIGTTNDRKYLVDATGNRRYWPVTVTRPIDIKAFRAIIPQLWAEASRLEQENVEDDEYIRLDPSLYGAAAVEQEARREKGPIELLLEERLGDLKGRIRVRDTWVFADVELGDRRRPSNMESKEISTAMTRLGWVQPRRALQFSDGECRAWIRGDEKDCLNEIVVSNGGKATVRTAGRTSTKFSQS